MSDDQIIASLNSDENQTRRRGQAEPSGTPKIAVHPRLLDGLVSQLERSRDELMKQRQTAIACVETAIARLHSLDLDSISGTAREMAVEPDATLHELNSIDPDARPEPERFFAIAGRIRSHLKAISNWPAGSHSQSTRRRLSEPDQRIVKRMRRTGHHALSTETANI